MLQFCTCVTWKISITYGLPVYGASEAELTAMQCFLNRCYKRKYTFKSFSIKHLLEKQDRKVFRKVSGIDRHPLRGLLPKKKESTYNLRNQINLQYFLDHKNYIVSSHETYVVIGWNSESLKFLSIGKGGGAQSAIRKAVRVGGLINRGVIGVFPLWQFQSNKPAGIDSAQRGSETGKSSMISSLRATTPLSNSSPSKILQILWASA